MANRGHKRYRRGANQSGTRPALWLAGAGLVLLVVALAVTLQDQAGVASTQAAARVAESSPRQVPDVTLQTVSGERLSLRDLQGRAVLVNFWASWCPPCKSEMPTLQEFHQTYQDDGLLVVAINAGESADRVEQFVDEQDLTFDVLLDPDMQAMAEFGVASLPTSIFIDRDGLMRGRHTGQLVMQQIESQMLPLK